MYELVYNIDIATLRWLNSWAGVNQFYDLAIIFRAEYSPWWAGVGILAFYFFGRDKKRELLMIVQAFASAVVARFVFTEIIRFFYNRPRPFEILENVYRLVQHSPGGSFPSGHAVFFFALAMGIYYYHRIWGAIFFLVAFSISINRVAAGLHWPSDILGGAVVGILSAILINFLFKKIKSLNQN